MPTRHAFLANPLPRPHVAPTPTPPDPTPVQSALAKLQLQLQLSHHASLHRYLRPISAPSSSYINPIHPTPAFLSSRSISPSPSPNPHLQKIENRKSNIKNPKMTSYIPPTRPPPSVLIAQACVLPPPPSPPYLPTVFPSRSPPLTHPPTQNGPHPLHLPPRRKYHPRLRHHPLPHAGAVAPRSAAVEKAVRRRETVWHRLQRGGGSCDGVLSLET